MKRFNKFLLIFIGVVTIIACTDKKKSNKATTNAQSQDSCQVDSKVVDIEPCTSQSAVYNLDPFNNTQVEAKIENGKVKVNISKENAKKIFVRMGDNESEGYDFDFDVEGLEGNCKALFWGNWGQEVNPLLCMLMDDGSVEILDINNAVDNYDFLSSGRLPHLENIVAFKYYQEEGGSGVLAIDSKGQGHDIELFLGVGAMLHLFEKDVDYTLHHYLSLTPDWKIDYGVVAAEEAYLYRYRGRFRGKYNIENNETVAYTFEICKALKADPNSEIGVSLQDYHGIGGFTIKKVEDGGMSEDFEIETTSGDIKFAKFEAKPRYGYRDIDPFSYKAED